MKTSHKRLQRAALVACAAALAATCAALVAVPAVDHDRAVRLATPYTATGEPQETLLDIPQAWLYAVPLAVCLVMIVRLRRRPDRRPLWVLLAAVTVWLLWRELPYSERLIGSCSFSWAKYLGDSGVPLGLRVAVGAATMAFTAGVAVYAIVKRRALLALVREKVPSFSAGCLVLSGLALVVAQMLDKHRTTDRLFGTAITAWDLKDYCEESLELVGVVLLGMACIMAAVEEPPTNAEPS